MEMLFGMESEDEVSFHVVYRLSDSDDWYAAGDLHGYPKIEDARKVGEAEKEKYATGKFGDRRVVEVGFYRRTVSVKRVD